MTQSFLFAASIILALTAMPGSGAVIYNETISGDLSGAFASPTPLMLAVGGNTIVARIGNNGNTGATNGSDADNFTVTLGTGESLVSMTLDLITSPLKIQFLPKGLQNRDRPANSQSFR